MLPSGYNATTGELDSTARRRPARDASKPAIKSQRSSTIRSSSTTWVAGYQPSLSDTRSGQVALDACLPIVDDAFIRNLYAASNTPKHWPRARPPETAENALFENAEL